MTTAKCPPRRPGHSEFASVVCAARLHLCAAPEKPEVRARHVAALVAFTRTVTPSDGRMRIAFEHGPTALWLAQALTHKDVELTEVVGAVDTVVVSSPQIVLGRYGFREGRWVFGQGITAAVGISRGAVHAAATFNRHGGMEVACPSTMMMLTVIAVMSRLGINAKPTSGRPRAVISPDAVPAALDRLGIAEIGAQYRRAVGKQS